MAGASELRLLAWLVPVSPCNEFFSFVSKKEEERG
jgi:hypothetical protein